MQDNSIKLVGYINSLEEFKFDSEIDGDYQRMGATLVDGVLQAGLNYKTVVKPRVAFVLSTYPEHKTTSLFLDLCKEEGIKKIISWKDNKYFTSYPAGQISICTSSDPLRHNSIFQVETFHPDYTTSN